MNSLVLPGEEASPAEVSNHHRQKILMGKRKKKRERREKRGHIWNRKNSGIREQEAGRAGRDGVPRRGDPRVG